MTTHTVHTADAPAKPSLYDDLRRLVEDTSRMEDALRGVAGALKAVCYGGMLDSLPGAKEDQANHEAATSILRLLENHVTDIVDAERDWDVSCELAFLADKAKDGRLIRYGKVVAE